MKGKRTSGRREICQAAKITGFIGHFPPPYVNAACKGLQHNNSSRNQLVSVAPVAHLQLLPEVQQPLQALLVLWPARLLLLGDGEAALARVRNSHLRIRRYSNCEQNTF